MSSPTTPTGRTVLIVDDSAMDRHLAGAIVQKLEGWKAAFAGNGVEALAVMKDQVPDLVLTDMLMPEMDGLELVQAIRSTFPLVPVILMTAHGSEDIALQALQHGAASYVPKKNLARDLLDTIDNVLHAAAAEQDEERVLKCLTEWESSFVLDNDVSLVMPLVRHLEYPLKSLKLCNANGLLRTAVSLREALVNAIEHGNLELSSGLRDDDERAYKQLREQRRQEEPYRCRRVYVQATFTPRQAAYVIRDEGAGFEVAALPDHKDPAALEKSEHRGLFLVRTFMDQVTHNEKGNQVTMVRHRD
jgi:CheY-like chemotaxis protein